MTRKKNYHAALTACALSGLLAACGGGGTDEAAVSATGATTATILRASTTPTPVPTVPSPLPTTAPAPETLVRESFGLGPDVMRPAGGKGDLRATWLRTPLNGFWVEWPGSKATAWLTPAKGQTWRLCGTNPSPYELPSPLQGDASTGFLNAGCASSEWFDLPVLVHPTALLPFTPPTTTAWAVSMEGYPSVVDGAYVAVGLTSSPLLVSNSPEALRMLRNC